MFMWQSRLYSQGLVGPSAQLLTVHEHPVHMNFHTVQMDKIFGHIVKDPSPMENDAPSDSN